MEVQEIKLIIDADGQVHLEVFGVQGLSCLELTNELEAALGGEIIDRQMKASALENPPGSVAHPPHLKTSA